MKHQCINKCCKGHSWLSSYSHTAVSSESASRTHTNVALPAADAHSATRRVARSPLREPDPYMGGCAGAGRQPLLAVVPPPPLPLTLPGAGLLYAASPTPASASSRRPLAWGDATRLVSGGAE